MGDRETTTEAAGWGRCGPETAVSGGGRGGPSTGAVVVETEAGSVVAAAVAEPGSVVAVVVGEFVAGCGTAGAPEEQSRR